MRRIALLLAIGISGLAPAGTLQAGVYNLNPPSRYPSDYVETNTPRPLDMVMIHLGELRQIQDDVQDPAKPAKPDSLRAAYERQVAELEARRKVGVLNAADYVNLSGCMIRMGGEKPSTLIWKGEKRLLEAEHILEKALRELPPTNPYRCLLLLHRAAVYQALAGENAEFRQRALRFQEEALQSWPKLMPGWTRQEREWFRRAEIYTQALMEMRHRELTRPAARAAREMPPPDQLFPLHERDANKKVRFVGDSGKYEAGGIAMKQLDRLPADADQIALQLLLWRPYDHRLMWLQGELLNARGNVDWAFYVLNAVKNMGWQNAELENHQQILKKAQAPFELFFRDKLATGDNVRLQARLLWIASPRGGLSSPGLGTAANELAGWTASTCAAGGTIDVPPARGDTVNKGGTTARQVAGNPLPDWRRLAVSFVTGMIVAVLGLLQWQQWRRRSAVAYRAKEIADGR